MIDEIFLNNSDDITEMETAIEENALSNKNLEAQIDNNDKEIETRLENIKTQIDSKTIHDTDNTNKSKDEKHNA